MIVCSCQFWSPRMRDVEGYKRKNLFREFSRRGQKTVSSLYSLNRNIRLGVRCHRVWTLDLFWGGAFCITVNRSMNYRYPTSLRGVAINNYNNNTHRLFYGSSGLLLLRKIYSKMLYLNFSSFFLIIIHRDITCIKL